MNYLRVYFYILIKDLNNMNSKNCFRKESLRVFFKNLIKLDQERSKDSFIDLFLLEIKAHLKLSQMPLCFIEGSNQKKIEVYPQSELYSPKTSFEWFKYQRNLQSLILFRNKKWKTLSDISSAFNVFSGLTIAVPLVSMYQKYWFIFHFDSIISTRLVENILKLFQKIVDYQQQKNILLNTFLKEKLRIKEESVQFLLHQLKTPLSKVTESFLKLEDCLNLSSVVDKDLINPFVESGKNCLLNLDSRIRSYLDIIRIEHEVILSPIDLKFLLEEVVKGSFFNLQDNESIQIQVDSNVKIQANRSLTYQIFENLIQNSLDSLKDNVVNEKKEIKIIQTQISTVEVLIEVIDSGQGVVNLKRESIFEPFFSSKLEGHGLGLFFCRKVISAMSGSISYCSSMFLNSDGFHLKFKRGKV